MDKENHPQQRLHGQVLPQNMAAAGPVPALTGCVTSTRHDDPRPMRGSCQVKLVGGVECYMVDEETDCFVFDLLTAEECDELIEAAERHVNSASGGEGWRKLYTYTKVSRGATATATDSKDRARNEASNRGIRETLCASRLTFHARWPCRSTTPPSRTPPPRP